MRMILLLVALPGCLLLVQQDPVHRSWGSTCDVDADCNPELECLDDLTCGFYCASDNDCPTACGSQGTCAQSACSSDDECPGGVCDVEGLCSQRTCILECE